jgi:hypothetical protein
VRQLVTDEMYENLEATWAVIRDDVTANGTTAQAQVKALGISGFSGDRLQALVYVIQSIGHDHGDVSSSVYTPTIDMVKVGDRWLIDRVETGYTDDASVGVPEPDPERFAAMSSATAFGRAMFEFHYHDREPWLKKLSTMTTPEYMTDIERGQDERQRQQEVSDIDGTKVGLVSIDDASATVLVALSGTQATISTGGADVSRNYALTMTLVKSATRWLVDDMAVTTAPVS